MPILFQCQSCLKWLEVDEPYAGQKAVCPFCQAVNNVPKTSQPGAADLATTDGNPTSPGQTEHQPGTNPTTPPLAPSRRQPDLPQQDTWEPSGDARAPRASAAPAVSDARRHGRRGMRLTFIGWGVYFVANVAAALTVSPEALKKLQAHPDPAVLMEYPAMMVLGGISMLALLTSIVGLGMCLAVLFGPKADNKSHALTGVIIGGLLFLWVCGGMLTMMGMGK